MIEVNPSGGAELARGGGNMQADQEYALRQQLAKVLAGGLETRTEPFPKNGQQITEILSSMQQLDSNDLKSKLVLSGFSNHPYGEDKMRCQECMYYLPHRKWCNLPEISLPVEPDWHCRLWRI